MSTKTYRRNYRYYGVPSYVLVKLKFLSVCCFIVIVIAMLLKPVPYNQSNTLEMLISLKAGNYLFICKLAATITEHSSFNEKSITRHANVSNEVSRTIF